jgi:hypothetical protein
MAFPFQPLLPAAAQLDGSAPPPPPPSTAYGGGLHGVSAGITGANNTGITQTLHTIEHGISA